MKGSVAHELEVPAPAANVWDIYGGLGLVELTVRLLPNLLEQFEVVEGDGGEGTVLKAVAHLPSDPSVKVIFKEKFVRIDNENRVKETAMIEGGFIDIGFQSYLNRIEIVGRDEKSCVIKSTIEYETGEGAPAELAAGVDITSLVKIAEAVKKYLADGKADI